MKLKTFWQELPKIPFTALLFQITVTLLWSWKIIPPPNVVVSFLQGLYDSYGLLGLAIATFLEGIAYLGLYFPGSFIIALAVFFSDGGFLTLFTITLIVTITLTVTSFINYFLGKHFSFKNTAASERKLASKGLLVSMLHPNLLAFYFFNEGVEKGNISKIALVPLVMIPYGLVFSYALYIFSGPARQRLEDPWFISGVIFGWVVVSFIIEHFRRRKKNR